MPEVQLTTDQEAFVRRAIADGRLQNAAEAIQQALQLWEQRERRRMEILFAIERADASIVAGQGIPISPESMRELTAEVKRRGRARLQAEQPPAP
jgi:putative addiction module CopG family antidote